MNCHKCNGTLIIATSEMSFEGDHSPDSETKAFNNLTMVCINTQCDLYGGGKGLEGNPLPLDLSNPKVIIEVLKQPMN